MDLRQLRYFTEIVDLGSLKLASDVVRISQPALSIAIQNLETELGVKLFDRVGRRIVPTRDGHYLYRHARAMLAQSERVKADLKAQQSLDKAEIKVAAPMMIASSIVARPTIAFMRENAGLRMEVLQMGGAAVQKALLEGGIDIGFLSQPPHSAEIAARPVCETSICAYVSKNHVLAERTAITWIELFEHSIITLPKSYVLRDVLKEKAIFYRCFVDVALESDVLGLLLAAIGEGKKIGVLLENISALAPDLVALPIHDVKATTKSFEAVIYACTLLNMPSSFGTTAYLDFVEKMLKSDM